MQHGSLQKILVAFCEKPMQLYATYKVFASFCYQNLSFEKKIQCTSCFFHRVFYADRKFSMHVFQYYMQLKIVFWLYIILY